MRSDGFLLMGWGMAVRFKRPARDGIAVRGICVFL